MNFTSPISFNELISDLNTLTTIAQANLYTKDVAALVEGESRPAAVLFLDIVNYSGIASQIPAEKLTLLIDRIFRIFELTVKSYGGYCDKVIGDAGLYVFPGSPAHPPAIEGALRAGLVLLERAQQLHFSLQSQGIDFNIRIGVAFGEVTRQKVGGDSQNFTVMGHTVNLAQRLEATAENGTLQVLPEIVQAVGDLFEFQLVGIKDLKNIGNSTVYKVVGLKERVFQFRTSGGYLSKLIGRDNELNLAIATISNWLNIQYPKSSLDITVSDNIPRRNRLLVIKGSVAIGKSRLAYEIQQYFVKNFKANVTTAHCLPNNMLDQFAAELVRVANINADNLPERWEELCAFAENYLGLDYANRQRKHLNLLALLLNCNRVDTSTISRIDPQGFVLGVQLAFCAACELISIFTGKPVLVIIEDIHWLSSYQKMLANIMQNAALINPLVFIATTRPEFDNQIESYSTICECVEINLNPITASDGRKLISNILPGIELPEEVWAQIEDKSEGIPYYYEEFARMLVRKGYVVNHDGTFELVRELSMIELPDDIQMLILGKLDQLEPKLKQLVSKASVLGRGFLTKILVEIEKKLADGEPDNLLPRLHQLVLLDIFFEELENDKYYFKHLVTQESAYKAMLERNKWLLHSLAAEIIEALIVPGSKTERELLASLILHLEFIRDYLKAHIKCSYLIKLFIDFGINFDYDFWKNKADQLYKKAKELDNTLPEQSPWFLSGVDGTHLRRLGKYQEALKAIQLAIDYFKQLNNTQSLASAYNNAGLVYRNLGDYNKAEELYLHAQKIVDQDNFVAIQSIYENIGNLYRLKGNYDLSLDYFNKAKEINYKIGNIFGIASVTSSIANTWVERKNFAEALKHFQHSLKLMQDLNDFRGITVCLSGLALVYKYLGEYELAIDYYKQSLVNLKQMNDWFHVASVFNNIGLINIYQNNFDDALNSFEESLRIRQKLGDKRGISVVLNNIGYLYLAFEKFDEAYNVLIESLKIKAELDDIAGEISTLESLTQLMIEKKELVKATEYCQTGEQLAIENNDQWHIAFFAADWALIHYYSNNPQLALEYLTKAKQITARLNIKDHSELGKHIEKAAKIIQGNS